jgi:hypothetical protein
VPPPPLPPIGATAGELGALEFAEHAVNPNSVTRARSVLRCTGVTSSLYRIGPKWLGGSLRFGLVQRVVGLVTASSADGIFALRASLAIGERL